MSGDVEQEYFADGMVEDTTTALSRIKWLFVIARNSSFTYKGKAVDIKQVGRELGVRYVLEGSVRKAGGRVRISRSAQHGPALLSREGSQGLQGKVFVSIGRRAPRADVAYRFQNVSDRSDHLVRRDAEVTIHGNVTASFDEAVCGHGLAVAFI
jgi:hypothetical protein